MYHGKNASLRQGTKPAKPWYNAQRVLNSVPLNDCGAIHPWKHIFPPRLNLTFFPTAAWGISLLSLSDRLFRLGLSQLDFTKISGLIEWVGKTMSNHMHRKRGGKSYTSREVFPHTQLHRPGRVLPNYCCKTSQAFIGRNRALWLGLGDDWALTFGCFQDEFFGSIGNFNNFIY